MTVQLKVGDKVVCIDAYSVSSIKVGEIYTIKSICDDFYRLEGFPEMSYYQRRFKSADSITAADLNAKDKVNYVGKEERYQGMHGEIGPKGTYRNDDSKKVAEVIWKGPGNYKDRLKSTHPVDELKKRE